MEIITTSSLYFDGTRAHAVVARSLAAFGSLYDPDGMYRAHIKVANPMYIVSIIYTVAWVTMKLDARALVSFI